MFMVSDFLGYFLMVLGASVAIQPKFWLAYAKHMQAKPFQVIPLGFFTLALGLFVVLAHPIWSQSLDVMVTILGWLMLIKGTLLLCLPQLVLGLFPLDKMSALFIRIEGVFLVVIGVVLACYL